MHVCLYLFTHWDLLTPYGVMDVVIIGSGSGILTIRRQDMTKFNANLMSIVPLETSLVKFS